MEIDYNKLRGGYYTPSEVAEFLVDWLDIRIRSNILEPSAGDGAFVKAILKKVHNSNDSTELHVTAIEIDPNEKKKIDELLPVRHDSIESETICDDFFKKAKDYFSSNITFDAVVGNPPFIRYQNFVELYRDRAFDLMKEIGLTPNKLTNIWVPFLVVSAMLLRKGGRLAMVIPAELFQVNYAGQTRKFLTDEFTNIIIITFRKLLFKKAQQEIILLLAEKDGNKATSVQTVELNDESELVSLNIDTSLDVETKRMIHNDDKWTYYLLGNRDMEFLRKFRKRNNIPIANRILRVDVGVVTGRNDFFVLSPSSVKRNKLTNSVERIIARSGHLKGIVMNDFDWKENVEKDYRSFIFMPKDKELLNLSDREIKYIKEGQKLQYNKGFKCRIRKRWYIVPSVWKPDAFMLRQIHDYPKIVWNAVGATCTDTIHRVKIKEAYCNRKVCAAFLNSLTFAFSELIGRSYGGGVMTFEPSECEKLPLPIRGYESLPVERIDELIRQNRVEEVLEITDKILLIDNMGISEEEVYTLREIWKKLRDRRINRKKG